MDPLGSDCPLDFLDYNFINDDITADFSWFNQSAGAEFGFGSGGVVLQEKESIEKECSRKRGRSGSFSRQGTKACRERLRREKLNDRFSDLSSVIQPGRPIKTDKAAIIDDAIRALNQLKTEAQELKEKNEKLSEEIRSLKVEKNELREEKLILKADKEKLQQKLKTMAVPSHPAAYHSNKMAVFPGYAYVPMWQYMPTSARDTSQDHQLRPPAA